MSALGKMLVVAGIFLVAIGLVVWGLGKAGFRGLPGDVRYEGERVRVYFPLVTCLVISAVVTLAVWWWRWFSGR